MESQKITKRLAERWYDDACGTALALEFVGERWSLLVIRELMFGPRRFSELKANLPGISANILTQRLAGMEAAGILIKHPLPSHATLHAYALTPWGLEAEPIFQAMGRWALRSRRHDPTLFLSPASAMLSLRTMIDEERAWAFPPTTLGFRFPTDRFAGTLADGALTIRRGDPAAPDIVFDTDTTSFVGIVYGKRPIAEAEATGALRLAGDRARAEAFVDLFRLPEKIG